MHTKTVVQKVTYSHLNLHRLLVLVCENKKLQRNKPVVALNATAKGSSFLDPWCADRPLHAKLMAIIMLKRGKQKPFKSILFSGTDDISLLKTCTWNDTQCLKP